MIRRGRPSSTPTRSTRKPPADDLPRRGPVRRVSPGRRRPSRSPADSWSVGSLTSTPRPTAPGHDTLFDLWRFPAFFTTAAPDTLDTVAADKTHRGHAIIEQVHADLKSSALAHPPSGVFTATPPGWCSRSSRSTSPEQPAPSPPQNWPGRQLRPCDANSSRSTPGRLRADRGPRRVAGLRPQPYIRCRKRALLPCGPAQFSRPSGIV